MANTYTAGPPAPLPALTDHLAGAYVDSSDWIRVAELLNLTHAEGSLGRWSQTWSPGIAINVAGPATMTYPMRVPVLSWGHTLWRVWIYCGAAVAPGSITVQGLAGAAVFAVPIGASWQTATMAAPASPATYDDLTIVGSAGVGGDVGVVHVSVTAEPLASPLALGLVAGPGGTYEPHGTASLAPDYPLTSARLRSMADDIATLYQRTRVLYSATSATGIVTGYKAGTVARYQPRGYLTVPRIAPSADPLSRSYTVWARVTPDAAATTYVRLTVGVSGPTTSIPVAAGGADVWVSGTLDLSAAAGAGMGAAVTPHTSLSCYSGQVGDPSPQSTATVRSLTVWGA